MASVRAQSFASWEHIIVDDGSDEDVEKVLERALADDERIRLMRQPRGGPCRARNTGYSAANPKSKYLLFLDQDDVLQHDMLDVLVNYMSIRPQVGMAFCDRAFIDDEDKMLRETQPRIPRFVPGETGDLVELTGSQPKTPFISIYAYSRIAPSVVLLRRGPFERAGRWDEGILSGGEDTDLWLRVALHDEIHFVPKLLVLRRIHSASRTSTWSKEPRGSEWMKESKWSRVCDFPPETQSLITSARHFRQHKVLPHLLRQEAFAALRRGQMTTATKFLIKAQLSPLVAEFRRKDTSTAWVADRSAPHLKA